MDGGLPQVLAETASAIGDVPGVADVGAFGHFGPGPVWALPLTLLAPPGGTVPSRTAWFLVTNREDGSGRLELHPATTGGLLRTHRHQAWNGPVSGRPWGTGAICPRSSPTAMTRFFAGDEPTAFPERGVWLIEAALRWLDAASSDRLIRTGEPFELPAVPAVGGPTVAFSEDATQLDFWQHRIGTAGLAELVSIREGELAVVLGFGDHFGRPELALRWGDAVHRIGGKRHLAAWLALPQLPVQDPWHLTTRWDELLPVLESLCPRRDPMTLLRGLKGLGDGQRHLLLLGAPIPATQGGPPVTFQWLALELPRLAGTATPTAGFRPSAKSRARFNDQVAFRHDPVVHWKPTSNWHPSALAVRGTHPELGGRRCLLLGAGALGSSLAELLVRDGLRSIHLFDGDTVQAGNLTRHTSLLINVTENKAVAIAARLNLANPHASVRPHRQEYPPRDGEVLRETRRCDLVLDLTANTDLLRTLGAEERPDALFASVWMGFRGRRVYVFLAHGPRFPFAEWDAETGPWLRVEREEVERHGLVWEGVGCWSAVFSAHPEDVWDAATTAVRLIVNALRTGREGLIVYELGHDDDHLPCRRRLHSPGDITREPLADG